jgi:hypothetical protein
MAIVVIGGLITSTVLSLLVIPVVFTYVDDLLLWLKRLVASPARAEVVATPSAASQAGWTPTLYIASPHHPGPPDAP